MAFQNYFLLSFLPLEVYFTGLANSSTDTSNKGKSPKSIFLHCWSSIFNRLDALSGAKVLNAMYIKMSTIYKKKTIIYSTNQNSHINE